jgi:hypothetical protein
MEEGGEKEGEGHHHAPVRQAVKLKDRIYKIEHFGNKLYIVYKKKVKVKKKEKGSRDFFPLVHFSLQFHT